MRENESRFKAHNVHIVIVTFEAGFLARQYVQATGICWPILVDEKKELYNGYGMLKASFFDIWGPKTWLVYCREILKGHWPKKSSGDISQRGGDVLVDPNGIVQHHHVGDGPADRPTIDSFVRILEKQV